MDLTPAMKQYMDIKRRHKDAILFFRMGDFYEMFFEDAIVASRILDIALTTRDRDSGIPMCGVPHHSKDQYIVRLLREGFNVAVCEQFEQQGKSGIFRREVVEVLTPGLIPREDLLDSERGNFLVSIHVGKVSSISAADISTGELYFERYEGWERLFDSLSKIDVAEIVFSEDTAERIRYAGLEKRLPPDVPRREIGVENPEEVKEVYRERFSRHVPEDDGFFLLLSYILRNQPASLKNLKDPKPFQERRSVSLDESALTSLEILRSVQGTRKGSLLWVLDRTKTPMGKRLIKNFLAFPLSDIAEIVRRHDAVEEFILKRDLAERISGLLEDVFDLERLGTKLSSGTVNPKDLTAISASLKVVSRLREEMESLTAPWLVERRDSLHIPEKLVEMIDESIVETPPLSIKEGGIFRPGFDEKIDELREIEEGGQRFLQRLEEKERERTGIPTLKVKYNRVFGYFIEVSKSYAASVPPEYVRKQTLVNAERYITPELKEFETRQLSAREERKKREESLFRKMVQEFTSFGDEVTRLSRIVGEVDVILSFAIVAAERDYTRPRMREEMGICIRGGRHPVVEAFTGRKEFVPNDTALSPEREQIAIITGPNMAGKSTYIRQVALITIMAQAGSFVPAEEAEIGVVDSVFTRIGAGDNIFLGESTFMVEMKEVARILRDVTDRSLIILDEVGRGTSTFDGLSIAWAVLEYIHNLEGKRPLTLFATHYHEVCELEKTLERVVNYNVAVKEWGDQVLFLHRIERGPSSRSYGIYVGKIAGLPEEVTKRAREVLKSLESEQYNERRVTGGKSGGPVQLSLFAPDRRIQEVGKVLESLDVERLTPLEALNLVAELKDRWTGKRGRKEK
ncbi:MAG: DNA mismatch repair protein MutS [Deltaproteobacteria bacterium]|nr:MAG: DNA mismatch repair protein MutS [Deltaproteobacteria bacterium]